jgi:hypothetical protein
MAPVIITAEVRVGGSRPACVNARLLLVCETFTLDEGNCGGRAALVLIGFGMVFAAIERMLVRTTRYVIGATVCLTCLFETPAQAEETLLSTEIRAGLFPPSFRWSNHLPTAAPLIDNAEKSLYFVPYLGARYPGAVTGRR